MERQYALQQLCVVLGSEGFAAQGTLVHGSLSCEFANFLMLYMVLLCSFTPLVHCTSTYIDLHPMSHRSAVHCSLYEKDTVLYFKGKELVIILLLVWALRLFSCKV